MTIAFAVLFVVTGCWWAVRAERTGDLESPGGTVTTHAMVVTSARIGGLRHALMSLGMAGMLVAMI